MNLRIQVLGPDWLEQSAAEWQDVLNDSDAHPVFMSWAWVQSWWETFGCGRQLRIVGCFEAGRLIAVAPFCLDAGWHPGSRGRLELVGQQVAGADYLDIVCRRSHVDAVVAALGLWLTSQSSFPWHRAAFEGAIESSIIGRLVQQLAGTCQVRKSVASICPVLVVQGEWDTFLRSRFDRKRRYNIERQARIALAANNGLGLSLSTDPEPALRALDAVFALHRLRKGQQGVTTSFTGEKIVAFHRRLVPRLGLDGQILIATLDRNTEPVAAAYCFIGGRSISYFQAGFDPAYEQLGVGSVLLVELMRFAHAKNMEEFDFLRGNEAYKFTWANESRPLYRWELFRRTPAGYGLAILYQLEKLCRALVRRVRQAGRSGPRVGAAARAVRRQCVSGAAVTGDM